jgi:hypothetical protein
VLIHALKHYLQRLKNLANNDEIVQHGNDIIKKDLEDNIKEAYDAAEHIAGVDTLLLPTSFGNKKAIVEPALTCYIADLGKSKEMLREKLGGTLPNLESLDREIQVAEFCKNTLL